MILFIFVALAVILIVEILVYLSVGYFDGVDFAGTVVAGLAIALVVTLFSLAFTWDIAPTDSVTKEYDLHPMYSTGEVFVVAKENRYDVRIDEGVRSIDSNTATVLSTRGEIEPKLVYTEQRISSNWWTRSLGIVGKSSYTSSIVYIDKDTLNITNAGEGKSAQLLKIK